MRDSSFDRTIDHNDVHEWRFLMKEYEEVKACQPEMFAAVGAFYHHHGAGSQTFRKYYSRCLRSGRQEILPPQKRGPRWAARWISAAVEADIHRAPAWPRPLRDPRRAGQAPARSTLTLGDQPCPQASGLGGIPPKTFLDTLIVN